CRNGGGEFVGDARGNRALSRIHCQAITGRLFSFAQSAGSQTGALSFPRFSTHFKSFKPGPIEVGSSWRPSLNLATVYTAPVQQNLQWPVTKGLTCTARTRRGKSDVGSRLVAK